MNGLIEVRSIERLSGISSELGEVYTSISDVNTTLINDHNVIRQCWVDSKVEEFSANFETASEYLWQLLVAISNMQEFLSFAAEAYSAAEQRVSSL